MTQQHDTTDPIFFAIEEQRAARAELIEASRILDRAMTHLAEKERQLLATVPETKAGAAALLTYLAGVLEPHEDVGPLALPALAAVKSVLIQ